MFRSVRPIFTFKPVAIALALTPFLPSGACVAKPAPKAKPKTAAKSKPVAKPAAKSTLPAIFYDKWQYKTITYYEGKETYVSGVSGDAKFGRDGKFEQNYYIGSIGNFFKGTYKIKGDRLITYDEKGKEIFNFKYTIGQNPPILVLTLPNKDGSPSIIYSLQPPKKK